MSQPSNTTGRRFPLLSRRLLTLLSIVAVLSLALAGVTTGIASASYPTNNVTVYTGCLTTSGIGAGQINSVAASPTSPVKPCNPNQAIVHISGGTITSIVAGTGLVGGGTNGYVSVSLAPAYSLPQSCSAGNVPGWTGSAWTCYSAGAGLSANTGSNDFEIKTPYQLPQSCIDGQLPRWTVATNSWSCADQKSYSGADFALSNQGCGSGQFVSGIDSAGHTQCANDQTYSGADFALSNQACATGQFTSGVNSSGKVDCSSPPTNTTDVYSTSGCCNFTGPAARLLDFGTTNVLTLDLPAGNYLLSGKTSVSNQDSSDQAADCTLRSSGTDIDKSEFGLPSYGVANTQVVSLSSTLALTSAGSVELNCATQNGYAFDSQLTALAVTNLH